VLVGGAVVSGPTSRLERAVLDALSAALWSSTDADLLLARVRPADLLGVHGRDAIILAGIQDLRERGGPWTEPTPVIQSLREHKAWWGQRFRDHPPGDLPPVPPDRTEGDRGLLQAAATVFQNGRVFEVMCHIPRLPVAEAAAEIAAARRREVSAMVMRTVHDLVSDPPPGTTREERAEAISATLHQYRDILRAGHLYPPNRPRGSQRSAGTDRGR
jgi:hypothetical protein